MNLRKTVRLSRILYVLLFLIASLLILAVYPVRVLRKSVTVASPEEAFYTTSEPVYHDGVYRQAFYADYDRIEALDLFVTELTAGRYLVVNILDEQEVYRVERIVDLGEEELPCFVRIPLGISLNVGERYRLTVRNRLSTFRVGLNFSGGETPASFDGVSYNWEYLPGRELKMRLIYDLPVDKTTSLLLIGGIAAVAFALFLLIRFFYERHPDKDPLIVRASALRQALTALVLLSHAVLFVLNFPMSAFDTRPSAYLFYAAGIVLSALLLVFAVRSLTADAPQSGEEKPLTLRQIAVAALFAASIAYACCYVNGVSDVIHAYYQKRQMICMAAALLLMMPFRQPLRGLLTLPKQISPYGILMIVTGLAMVLMRNTRTWVLLLALFYLLIYYAAAPMTRDGTWTRIFLLAVKLHFFGSMGYCLLFRAFQAYQLIRFGFVFHTVTVTGEYLAMVTATGFAALLSDLRRGRPGWKELLFFGTAASYLLFTMSRIAFAATTGAVLMSLLWGCRAKGAVFAKKSAYPVRLVRIAAAGLLSVVIVFPAAFTMQRILPAMTGRHVMLAGPEETSTNPRILGKARWDSPYYVSPERFFKVFYARVLGGPDLPYFRPDDTADYDAEGRQLYDDNGNSIIEILLQMEREQAAREAQAAQEAEAEANAEAPHAQETEAGADAEAPSVENTPADTQITDAAQAQEAADDAPPAVASPAEEETDAAYELSNGRTQIWRDYIDEFNLTGHTIMSTMRVTNVHAHNTYIQAAYDFGLPVGILFFVWIGVTIIVGMKRDPVSFGVALVFALESFGEWTFHFSNPSAVIFLLAIAPLMVRRDIVQTDKKQTKEQASVTETAADLT